MEETEPLKPEVAKKKGGKLPIIVALVVILGAGGFFAMKIHGHKKAPPPVTLSAEKPVDLKQFLVNLTDKDTYCRTDISLGLATGASAQSITDQEPAIRDAINLRIMSKSLSEVDTIAGIKVLKYQIAHDVNKIVLGAEGKPNPAETQDPATNLDPATTKALKILHPEWDSQTGPVLKVYIVSFVTQ